MERSHRDIYKDIYSHKKPTKHYNYYTNEERMEYVTRVINECTVSSPEQVYPQGRLKEYRQHVAACNKKLATMGETGRRDIIAEMERYQKLCAGEYQYFDVGVDTRVQNLNRQFRIKNEQVEGTSVFK